MMVLRKQITDRVSILSVCLLCLTTACHGTEPQTANIAAKEEINYTSIKIKPLYNQNLSGELPFIKNNGFSNIYRQIRSYIATRFDTKAEQYPVEVSNQKIFLNNNYLSFSVNYNISNATERYFTKYYTVDLHSRDVISFVDYIKREHLNIQQIEGKIAAFINPCFSAKIPEYCHDIALQSLLDETGNKALNLNKSTNFYINGDKLGFGFDSAKFTYTITYNRKTGQITDQ